MQGSMSLATRLQNSKPWQFAAEGVSYSSRISLQASTAEGGNSVTIEDITDSEAAPAPPPAPAPHPASASQPSMPHNFDASQVRRTGLSGGLAAPAGYAHLQQTPYTSAPLCQALLPNRLPMVILLNPKMLN